MYENAKSQTFGIVFIKKSRFQNTMSSSFFKNTGENANMNLLSKFFFKCEILNISSQNCKMTKILKKNLLAWHHRSPLYFCPVAFVYLLSASSCSLFVLLSLLAYCFVAIARISCPHCFAWLESYGQGWKLELKKINESCCRDEKYLGWSQIFIFKRQKCHKFLKNHI